MTTRRIIGLGMAALCLLVGLAAGTQQIAEALAYDPALGAPLFEADATPIYAPWAQLLWEEQAAQVPEAARRAQLWLYGGLLASLLALAGARGRTEDVRLQTLHGSARWAERRDLERAGLLGEAGVILAQTEDGRYVRHDGPEHVLVFAPTRSGKGVGTVVPTLLTWPASVVVTDIKGENWALTGAWRARFSHVICWNPTDPRSASWNPLHEIRPEHEVRDAQNIADILVDPEGAGAARDHWQKTGHALLVGTIIHTLYAGSDKTLRGVANLLRQPGKSIETVLEEMRETRHLGDRPHPVVARAAQSLLNKAPNERSGVVSTALSFLELFEDPYVARATERCDFRLLDLQHGPHPLTLYIVVPPSDLSRVAQLVRLLLSMLVRRLTERQEYGGPQAYDHRLLLMLDEFPAFGRLTFFESALAFLAGYGIKAQLIVQSLKQLQGRYGPDNAILDNCHVRMAYASNDEQTGRRISELCGVSTISHTSESLSGQRGGWFLDRVSRSTQRHGRPLLTPDEVLRLPEDEAVVLAAGMAPARLKKLRYYADKALAARVPSPPAPLPLPESGPYPYGPPPVPSPWASRSAPAPVRTSAPAPTPVRASTPARPLAHEAAEAAPAKPLAVAPAMPVAGSAPLAPVAELEELEALPAEETALEDGPAVESEPADAMSSITEHFAL